MHRLRARFKLGAEVKFISHLDLIRLWQRAFQRARIPLTYSEGFSPHPKISLAAPLPISVTSDAELMDIYLTQQISPHFFISALSHQLPPGIEILQAYSIALNQPSLQSQVRFAEYHVIVKIGKGRTYIETAISSLLSADYLPWQHQRDTGPRYYDLRTLVSDLCLLDYKSPYGTIGMRLRCDSSGSGRPEQVVLALGFTCPPQSIHRTKLILKTG